MLFPVVAVLLAVDGVSDQITVSIGYLASGRPLALLKAMKDHTQSGSQRKMERAMNRWMGIERLGEWHRKDKFLRRNLLIFVGFTAFFVPVSVWLAVSSGSLLFLAVFLFMALTFIFLLFFLRRIAEEQKGMWRRLVRMGKDEAQLVIEGVLRREGISYRRLGQAGPLPKSILGFTEGFELDDEGLTIKIRAAGPDACGLLVGPSASQNRESIRGLINDLDRGFQERPQSVESLNP